METSALTQNRDRCKFIYKRFYTLGNPFLIVKCVIACPLKGIIPASWLAFYIIFSQIIFLALPYSPNNRQQNVPWNKKLNFRCLHNFLIFLKTSCSCRSIIYCFAALTFGKSVITPITAIPFSCKYFGISFVAAS